MSPGPIRDHELAALEHLKIDVAPFLVSIYQIHFLICFVGIEDMHNI